MAYPNFEAWLADFLQKSCGFSPEDANEIKDEITKNIEWYRQQAEKDSDQIDILIPRISPPPSQYPNPWVPNPSHPWQGQDTYIGDPLPGQEPTTWTDTTNIGFAKKYYSNFGFNEELSKRKDDSSDH